MALKNDWSPGDTYSSADQNAVADAVNHGPYDGAIVAVEPSKAREVGTVAPTQGVCLPRAITVVAFRYRFGSADGSGSTTIEVRKNGTPLSGTSKTVSAANQTNSGGAAREVTGSWSFDKGDVLTVEITAVGGSPGNGLMVDWEAVTA